MRRAFTLQMHPGGAPHSHNCARCGQVVVCGAQQCVGEVICHECMAIHNCPKCGEVMSLNVRQAVPVTISAPIASSTYRGGICTCGTMATFEQPSSGQYWMVNWTMRNSIELQGIHFHRCDCGSIVECDSNRCSLMWEANGGKIGPKTALCIECVSRAGIGLSGPHHYPRVAPGVGNTALGSSSGASMTTGADEEEPPF